MKYRRPSIHHENGLLDFTELMDRRQNLLNESDMDAAEVERNKAIK